MQQPNQGWVNVRLQQVNQGLMPLYLFGASLLAIVAVHAAVSLYSANTYLFYFSLGSLITSPIAYFMGSVPQRIRVGRLRKQLEYRDHEFSASPGQDSQVTQSPTITINNSEGSAGISDLFNPSGALAQQTGYTHWLTAVFHLFAVKEKFVQNGRCQFCNSEIPPIAGQEYYKGNHSPDCPIANRYEDILGMVTHFNQMISHIAIKVGKQQ